MSSFVQKNNLLIFLPMLPNVSLVHSFIISFHSFYLLYKSNYLFIFKKKIFFLDHIHNSNTPKTFKHALSLLNPISRSNKIRILPDIPEPNLEKQPIHSLIEEIQRSFRFNPSGNDNGELECNP